MAGSAADETAAALEALAELDDAGRAEAAQERDGVGAALAPEGEEAEPAGA